MSKTKQHTRTDGPAPEPALEALADEFCAAWRRHQHAWREAKLARERLVARMIAEQRTEVSSTDYTVRLEPTRAAVKLIDVASGAAPEAEHE